MGTKYALKNVRIKDSKIPKISMCGGGCGGGCSQGYHYEPPPPSCGGGCSLGYDYIQGTWIKKKKK